MGAEPSKKKEEVFLANDLLSDNEEEPQRDPAAVKESLAFNPKVMKAASMVSDYQDLCDAVQLLQQFVEEGDSDAMWILGMCNEFGLGKPRDIQEAERLYSLSSHEGNAIGSFISVNQEYEEKGKGVMQGKGL